MKKLAIVVTHPIQYYVPLFQLLAQNCDLKVFYTWGEEGAMAKYDPDFKQVIAWDLPLLKDYSYDFQENTAKDPGSHHFNGIVNPELADKIKYFAPDAILVYGWAYKAHLQVLRKFKDKTPIWFRGDSNLIDVQNGFKQILRNLFLKWIYHHVDKAFYVGTANKNYYLKFGLQANQLIFAPHAVENDRFDTDHSAEAIALRQQLKVPNDASLLLFAGKLEPKKNPALLLKAFLQLKNEKVHLLFVGNGVLEKDLKAEKILRQAQDDKFKRIHFMDFQNQTQMPIVYQACDLFCLPSKGPGETWGLAINEAMAAGKAIIVSDKVGCAMDLVHPKKNGEIFESENESDLLSKLNFLLSKPELLRNMGECSKNIIQNWSISQQANQILNTLNQNYEG